MVADFVHASAEVSSKAIIGFGTQIWHFVQVREGARIGENCKIGKDVYIDCYVYVATDIYFVGDKSDFFEGMSSRENEDYEDRKRRY